MSGCAAPTLPIHFPSTVDRLILDPQRTTGESDDRYDCRNQRDQPGLLDHL